MLETKDLIWALLLIGTAASLQVDIVPAQGEISVGESKFFLCTVTGEADLITWFSPSGDKIETGQRISVVRNDDLSSTLTVYSADIDDAGTYKCVATFDGNESQATVNMKIFQKLTFRNAPSLQEYNEGDDAVIICDVTSSPPPNVIWKHRSREIIHKKDVRFSVLSNNYLQIRGIKKSDEGTYRCEGRILARGEISFKDIQIIVNVPPAIRTRQTELNATSDIGQSVTLVCDADGFPEPAVSWARVKNVLEESDKYSFTEDGSQMTILNVKKEDQGEYTCIAKNKAGETEQEFSLNVFVKPKITYVENKTALELEEQITLTCEAIGDPTPSIVWSSASRIFTEGEQASWTRPEKYESLDGNVVVRSDGRVSSLTLKDIQYTDAGQYVCTARSSIGQDSQSMFLEVHYAPKLQGSITVYTWEGNPANITCEVFAHPGASVVWFRDGQQLPNANTTNIKIYPTPTASFLEITPDSQSDFGNYNCTATNRIGQESKEFILIQAEVPSSPLINEVSPYSSTARVEFEEPDSSGGVPVLKYKAEWRVVGTSEWMRKEFDARNVYTENLITITGLRPNSRYELRMSAINGKGQGESSESTVFKTEPVHLLYTQYKLLSVLLLSYAPVSKSPLVEEIDFSLMNYNPPQANQFTKEFKAHQLKSAFMKGDSISFFGARRLFSANEEHENAQGGALVESEEDTQGDEQQSSTNLLEEDKEDLEQAVVTYVEELSSGADDIPVEPTEGDEAEVSSIPSIPTAPVDVVVATDLPTEPTEGETESAESEEEPLHPSAAGEPQGEAFSAAESLVLLHTEQTADELTTAEADVLPVVETDGGTHVQEVTTVQMIEKEMDATEEATVETTGSEGAIEGTAILMQLDHVPESTEPGRGAGPLTERPPATEESLTEKPGVVQMGGLGTVPSEVVSELATGAPVEPPAEHPTGMPVNLVLEEYTALPTVETDGIVPVMYITEVTEDPVGGQVEKISTEAAAGEIESITAAQEEQSLQATKALASQELITGVTVSTTQLILEETGANVFKFIMTAEPTDSASGNPPETTVASAFTTQSATPVSGDPVEDTTTPVSVTSEMLYTSSVYLESTLSATDAVTEILTTDVVTTASSAPSSTDREPSPPKLEGKPYESGNTLKVNWIKQDDGGSPIRHYLVRYRAKQMDDWKPEIRLPADSEYAILGGLEWNTEYEVYVVAENQQGKSRPSTLFFRTVPEPTSMPDEMASGSGLGTGAIVGILIIVFIILLVVVDVTCYFLNKCGLLMCIAVNVCGKPGPGAKGKDMEEGKAAFSKDESKEPIVEVRTEDEHTPNHDGGNLTEPNETTPLTEPEHPADTTATVEDMIPSVATNSDTITETFATAQNSPSSETTTLTSSITAPATTPVQQASTPKAGVTSPTSPAPASTEAASKVAPLVDLSDTPAANSPAAPSPNPTNASKAPTATKTQAPAAPPEAVSIPTLTAEPPKPKTEAVKSPENEAAQPNSVKSPTEAAKNPTSPKNPSAPDSNAKPSQNEDFRVDLDLAKDVFAVWGNDPPPAVNQAAVPAPADSTKPSTPAKDEKVPVEEKTNPEEAEIKKPVAEVKTVPNEATQTNGNESKA